MAVAFTCLLESAKTRALSSGSIARKGVEAQVLSSAGLSSHSGLLRSASRADCQSHFRVCLDLAIGAMQEDKKSLRCSI